MSTAKQPSTVGYGMGGQRSGKKTGIIVQSIRISVADNNKMHRVAKAEGRSFNSWAAMVLKREAEKFFIKRKGTQPKKEVVSGEN
jgi:hypothetical protein